MANYPQELAQDAVCQSHTGHMTGLWFLPARHLRLNTTERILIKIGFFRQIFEKPLSTKSQREPSCSIWTDGRTEGYPYFDVVVGLVRSHDPESYAGGSECYW